MRNQQPFQIFGGTRQTGCDPQKCGSSAAQAAGVTPNRSSNDEVKRRGVALPLNEDALSQSSTPSLAHRRRGPRSLEPIVRPLRPRLHQQS